MGLRYNVYLDSNRIYTCKKCKTHLSNHEDIISRVCCCSLRFFSTPLLPYNAAMLLSFLHAFFHFFLSSFVRGYGVAAASGATEFKMAGGGGVPRP
jgi:hypothetical protein